MLLWLSEIHLDCVAGALGNQLVLKDLIAVSEELVFRARCGEESAQASLYTALAPATFGLIRRIVGSRALRAKAMICAR